MQAKIPKKKEDAMSPRTRGSSSDERTVSQGPAPDPNAAMAAALEIFNEDWDKLNLHGKIARISGHLGRIPKNGYNKFNNYPYVLESDLVEAIRYYLAAATILIYPSVKEWAVVEGIAREGRSGDPRTDVLYEFRVVDGKTGETFSFDQLGQGSDPRDKGSNKASTSAMKFAYLRLFNIASGEDSEADVQGDQRIAMGGPQKIPVTITPSSVEGAQRGGKQATASGAQIRTVSNMSNQLGLGAQGLVGVIEKVLGDKIELPEEETKQSPVLASYLKEQKGEDIGKLIYALQEMVKAMAGEPADIGYGD